jgi:hypothetical protein
MQGFRVGYSISAGTRQPEWGVSDFGNDWKYGVLYFKRGDTVAHERTTLGIYVRSDNLTRGRFLQQVRCSVRDGFAPCLSSPDESRFSDFRSRKQFTHAFWCFRLVGRVSVKLRFGHWDHFRITANPQMNALAKVIFTMVWIALPGHSRWTRFSPHISVISPWCSYLTLHDSQPPPHVIFLDFIFNRLQIVRFIQALRQLFPNVVYALSRGCSLEQIPNFIQKADCSYRSWDVTGIVAFRNSFIWKMVQALDSNQPP